MKKGVIVSQTEVGTDPLAIRDYPQTAEGLGYDYFLTFDQVIGANSTSRLIWQGLYQHTDMFHEPFGLFA